MKVTYSNGKFSTDFEASSQKEVFEQVATFQEVFEETECGKCKSDQLRFLVREVSKDGETNKYYEMLCKKCGCRLAFGHAKVGNTMYPKRYQTDKKGKAVKDANGKAIYLPYNGWHKFSQVEDKAEEKDGGF